jgi:predicted ATPase/serine/threonine protein kinase/Tfp pilus assembly protein PilF
MTTAERWRRIGDLFEAALEQPPEERLGWLRGECSAGADVREEVEEMLAQFERTGGILDRSTPVPPDGAADSVALAAGGSVGPFRLVREAGRGGMGVVWQAHDPRLGRSVALKFLPAEARWDVRVKARFLVEARAASALDHPNVCAVHDVGETAGGVPYIAFAWYEGETLNRRIARGPLPIDEAVNIAAQTARGLQRAHEQGIVHRDIKPSNLMLTPHGDVKILDFGVAHLPSQMELTESGAVIGTWQYMSPEQVMGDEVGPASDLWSVGVVLYEMLTGQKPFRGKNEAGVTYAILHHDPVPVRELRPEVPRELAEAVQRLLAKSPAERFADAATLAAVLRGERQAPPPVAALPVPLTSFVGRERELARVAKLVETCRLVTLTGPGGTGKTRLALETGNAMRAQFHGGVHFVPLSTIADPDLVADAIAQSLSAVATPLSAVAAVKGALRDAEALLLLDNFEQVSAAAPLVADLLAACPRLKVIVTSRIALRLAGEHQFPVPPLDEAAVRLFVERAQAVLPDFALTDANASDVARLCRRLDGLPLAIELAAARSNLFSPATMLARLEAHQDVLRTPAPDRPARHRSLRQTMDWSYHLLAPPEQSLFRRFSVFAGGATLEDLEQLCSKLHDERIDALDGLATLVEHSLLRRQESSGGEPRFAMLDTIREYSQERLREAGEERETRDAHARIFLALAERAEPELTGARQVEWLNRLEAEHDNLRAALACFEECGDGPSAMRFGAAIWRFWLVRGHLADGRKRLDHLLSLPDGGADANVRARVLNGLGTMAHTQGDNWVAREVLAESLRLFRESGDRRGIASVLNNLAWVACEMTDLALAGELSTEGLRLNRELGDQRGTALALNNLGWVAVYRDDFATAREYFEQSLALRRATGDRRGVAFALSNLGWVTFSLGDAEAAETMLADAERILEAVNDQTLVRWPRFHKAVVRHAQGNLAGARVILESLRDGWREGDNRSILASVLMELGRLALTEGDAAAAQPLLEESRRVWSAIGGQWGVDGVDRLMKKAADQ